VRNQATRARLDWQQDDEFDASPDALDRTVPNPAPISTVARALCDCWQRDLFPTRQALPNPWYLPRTTTPPRQSSRT